LGLSSNKKPMKLPKNVRVIRETTEQPPLNTVGAAIPADIKRAARKELLASELFPNNGCAWSPDGEHELHTTRIRSAKDGTTFVTHRCTWCNISEETEI
jgi:hypothetical protein